jgi:hypothetical protein
VLAAEELPHTGRVLVSVDGDVSLPAGEHADVVVVVGGTATVMGEVNTIFAVDGVVELVAGTAETIVAVRSPVNLRTDSVVLGDVRTLDSAVQQFGSAEVAGSVRDLGPDLVGVGFVLAPAFLLFAIGFWVATLVAALALAALAARQVRATEALISRDPVPTLLAGLGGLIVPPILAVLAMITIVGAPLGLGLLLGAWPLAAFVGYLVAAIWIGDWLLARSAEPKERARPYLAATIGVIVLAVASIVPLVTGIASLFGLGAIVLLGWRTFTGRPSASRTTVPGEASAAAAA